MLLLVLCVTSGVVVVAVVVVVVVVAVGVGVGVVGVVGIVVVVVVVVVAVVFVVPILLTMRSNKSTQHAHTHRHGAAGSAGNGTQLTSSAHLRLTTHIERKLTRLDLLDVPSASSKEKLSFDLVLQVLFGSVDSTEADPRHIPTDQLLRINDTLRAHHNDLLLDEAVQNM